MTGHAQTSPAVVKEVVQTSLVVVTVESRTLPAVVVVVEEDAQTFVVVTVESRTPPAVVVVVDTVDIVVVDAVADDDAVGVAA